MIGDVAPLDMLVAVGFGVAHVLVDGALLLDGEPRDPGASRAPAIITRRNPRPPRDRRAAKSWAISYGVGRYLTLARVERYLLQRERSGAPVVGKIECQIVGPLSQVTLERQAPGRWVVTEEGDGFA